MTRSGTCIFCQHERHDTDCYARAADGSRCDCCGPTEAEQAAHDAPDKILSWLHEVLEAETWGSSTRVPVGLIEVAHYANHDYLEIDTKHGKFRLRIEKAP